MASSSADTSAASAAKSVQAKKKLIVLDVNEIFSRRIQNPARATNKSNVVIYSVNSSRHNQTAAPQKRYIELRPGIREFVSELKRMNFRLAFWSSTTYQNCAPTINALFSQEEQRDLFEFIWFRDRTCLDPEYGTNPEITNFDTVKNLEDIFSSPLFERRWDLSNTFIVDNSEKKLRFNPKENCFIIKSFSDTEPSGDGLDELMTFLRMVENR